MIDLGNIRLVGMTRGAVEKMFQARQVQDPSNQVRTLVYMFPQDVIDNTTKAFSVNATGYTAGTPSGRYFAPANSATCLETAQSNTGATLSSTNLITSTTTGFGDCGERSLIVTGPKVMRVDMSVIKRIPVTGTVKLETQLQIFNVFNRVNFNPVSGIGSSTVDGYQVTGAVDQSRTMQMAFRISF